MIYYQTIWAEKRFTSANHRLWLSNFKEEEKLNSLYLLSKFMFFGTDEIKELLISIFRDKFKYKIVADFRKKNNDTIEIKKINDHFIKELNDTRFVALGAASESGSHILMLFRQYNKLPMKYMKSSSDLFSNGKLAEPGIKHYIFIDDFCGSGETAIKCNQQIDELKKLNSSIKASYYVLFTTDTGLETVKKHSSFDNVETIFILDGTFKSFGTESRYFTENYLEIDKADTKNFCTSYGYSLVAGTPIDGYPLGFGDGQLLISFAHNTPDNSLPIFWGQNDWFSIFTRYIKTNS